MSTAACPRCSTALGLSRWCGCCGLDLRPDLAPAAIPEARYAETLQERWVAAHPDTVAATATATAHPGWQPAPAAPGFLPPVGASAPPAARPIVVDRYSSPRTRSLLAVRWLWLMVAIDLAALAADFDWLGEKTSPNWTYDQLISIGKLMDVATLVQLVTYLIAGVIFIVWFYRAYTNLRPLGVTKPRHASGWAIGAWFTPFISLIWPKQIGNDIWRAGDPALQPGDPRWQAIPVAPLVHWWWALWLIGNTGNVVANNLIDKADSIGAFEAAVIVDAVSQVLGLVSILAAMLFIKRATGRQEQRARVMGLRDAA